MKKYVSIIFAVFLYATGTWAAQIAPGALQDHALLEAKIRTLLRSQITAIKQHADVGVPLAPVIGATSGFIVGGGSARMALDGWLWAGLCLSLVTPLKAVMGTHPNFDSKLFLMHLPDEIKQSKDILLCSHYLSTAWKQQIGDISMLERCLRFIEDSITHLYHNGQYDALVYDRFIELCKEYGLEDELEQIPSKWMSTGHSMFVGTLAIATGILTNKLFYAW